MPELVAILAVASPVLQVAAMGFIAYPIAVRRPGGMDRFRRSGFVWWLATLITVLLVAVLSDPGLLDPTSPATGAPGVVAVLIGAAAGAMALVVIEIAGDAWVTRRGGTAAQQGRDRYESALPTWATGSRAEPALLGITAVLEEAVFRAVALGALIGAWSIEPAVAGAIVAVAFGAAHWYYGVWQITLKVIGGAALCAVAVEAGWAAAAVGHLVANLGLVWIARRGAA